jgi:hypothetical protein
VTSNVSVELVFGFTDGNTKTSQMHRGAGDVGSEIMTTANFEASGNLQKL